MCPGPSPKVFSVIRPFRRTREHEFESRRRRPRRAAPVGSLSAPRCRRVAKFGKQKIFSSPLAPRRGGRRSAVAAAAYAKTPPVRRLRPRVKDQSAPLALTSRDHPLSSRRETPRNATLSLLFSSSLHCVHLSVRGPSESAARPSRPATRREVARCSFSRTPGPRTPRGAHARTLGAYLPMPLPTVSVAHLIFLAGFNDD